MATAVLSHLISVVETVKSYVCLDQSNCLGGHEAYPPWRIVPPAEM